MYINKRKSLAGKCGIPFECNRCYVEVEHGRGMSAPCSVKFENGLSWHITSVYQKTEYGREFFGNACTHYEVSVGGEIKDLWEEYGRWFTRKSDLTMK